MIIREVHVQQMRTALETNGGQQLIAGSEKNVQIRQGLDAVQTRQTILRDVEVG